MKSVLRHSGIVSLQFLVIFTVLMASAQKKTVKPNAPSAPKAAAVGATVACPNGALHCAALSWTAGVVDATHSAAAGYNVYRGTCSTVSPLSAGCTKVATNVTLTTYIDSPLAASTTYTYVVTAFNTSSTGVFQESLPSNPWTGTTLADPVLIPNTPTGLTGVAQ